MHRHIPIPQLSRNKKHTIFQEVFKMKHLKSKVILFTAISVLSMSSALTVSAAGRHTPADIVASLTGRAVASVIEERFETGKTFGTIAAEAGKLDEFKSEMLSAKEEILNENVENGVISQEEAAEILDAVKERQAVCDGTGYGDGSGCGYGYGDGSGNGPGGGYGHGNGSGNGSGCGYGAGRGQGAGFGRGQGAGRGRW